MNPDLAELTTEDTETTEDERVAVFLLSTVKIGF
jgi:hypothetical protein